MLEATDLAVRQLWSQPRNVDTGLSKLRASVFFGAREHPAYPAGRREAVRAGLRHGSRLLHGANHALAGEPSRRRAIAQTRAAVDRSCLAAKQ